jgi:hypothetical protein
MESCVPFTLIPIIGAAVLAWHLSVRLGLAFSISDFGMPFYGYLRATFVQSAFTELIGVCLMASAAQNRSEA